MQLFPVCQLGIILFLCVRGSSSFTVGDSCGESYILYLVSVILFPAPPCFLLLTPPQIAYMNPPTTFPTTTTSKPKNPNPKSAETETDVSELLEPRSSSFSHPVNLLSFTFLISFEFCLLFCVFLTLISWHCFRYVSIVCSIGAC